RRKIPGDPEPETCCPSGRPGRGVAEFGRGESPLPDQCPNPGLLEKPGPPPGPALREQELFQSGGADPPHPGQPKTRPERNLQLQRPGAAGPQWPVCLPEDKFPNGIPLEGKVPALYSYSWQDLLQSGG